MVANEVLKDKNLSFKAKGLYAYLFSKPDKWDFSSTRMVLETTDGRKAIMGMLTELEESGYLKRNKLPNGKMEYILKYTNSQSTERELRQGGPEYRLGTVPKGNTYIIQKETNNTEKTVTLKKTKTHSIPFIQEDEMKKWKEGPNKMFKILALYLNYKGLKFENWEQWDLEMNKNIRSAKELLGYNSEQLRKTMDFCDKQQRDSKFDYDWKLSNVVKSISSVVNKNL